MRPGETEDPRLSLLLSRLARSVRSREAPTRVLEQLAVDLERLGLDREAPPLTTEDRSNRDRVAEYLRDLSSTLDKGSS